MPGYQWKEPKNGGRSLASRYKAGGIPHFVLISPEGKILKMWTGYRKGILKSKLKSLYQKIPYNNLHSAGVLSTFSKIKLYQARIIIFLTQQKF